MDVTSAVRAWFDLPEEERSTEWVVRLANERESPVAQFHFIVEFAATAHREAHGARWAIFAPPSKSMRDMVYFAPKQSGLRRAELEDALQDLLDNDSAPVPVSFVGGGLLPQVATRRSDERDTPLYHALSRYTSGCAGIAMELSDAQEVEAHRVLAVFVAKWQLPPPPQLDIPETCRRLVSNGSSRAVVFFLQHLPRTRELISLTNELARHPAAKSKDVKHWMQTLRLNPMLFPHIIHRDAMRFAFWLIKSEGDMSLLDSLAAAHPSVRESAAQQLVQRRSLADAEVADVVCRRWNVAPQVLGLGEFPSIPEFSGRSSLLPTSSQTARFLLQTSEDTVPRPVSAQVESGTFLLPEDVRVIWVADLASLEQAADTLETAPVIGVDAEWRPRFPGEVGPSDASRIEPVAGLEDTEIRVHRTALLQLAIDTVIFLFDLPEILRQCQRADGMAAADRAWARILTPPSDGGADVSVASFLGFNASGDFSNVASSFPEWPAWQTVRPLPPHHLTPEQQSDRRALVDLSSKDWMPALRRLSARSASPPISSKSLRNVVQVTLGRPLEKIWSVSDWLRRPLLPEQIHYAAMDAWCLLPVWRVLLHEDDDSERTAASGGGVGGPGGGRS